MNRRARYQSLGTRIMRGISIPVVVIFIIAASLILMIVRTSVNKMSETELTVKSQAASYQVSEFFSKYLSEVEQISVNRTYENMVAATAQGERFEDMPEFEFVNSNLVKSAKTDEENILSVWVAGFAGSQVMQSDGYISDVGWDVTSRPWYKVKETGEVFLTSPYEDVSTGGMIITAAAPLIDESTGEIIGATGIDIALQQLGTIMSKYTLGDTGEFLLTDAEHNIIYHADESFIGKNVTELNFSDNMTKSIENNDNTFQKYTKDDNTYYGYVSSVGDIRWNVSSMMPSEEYNQTLRELAIFIILLFMIGLAIVIVILRLISLSVVKPLKGLTITAQKIADGNLDVSVEVRTNDEIGRLGNAITNTVIRLKEYIRYIDEISNVLGKIAEGNLKFELSEEYSGDFSVLKTGLLQIQEKLTSTIVNMNQIAGQVEEGAKQISQVASSLAASSGEQAESVEILNQIVNQVNELAEKTKRDADAAKSSESSAAESLENGNVKMRDLTATIELINESSQRVSGIMTIIDDISSQTNLLSLNASIEAARAGEAGKGFAVVADEVGTLAQQTADSSKETRELIVYVLQEISRGSRMAEETSQSMMEVMQKAGQSAEGMDQISIAVQEETDAIAKLKLETGQITSAVESNMAVSEESVASSEELAAQATVLRKLVNEFKI